MFKGLGKLGGTLRIPREDWGGLGEQPPSLILLLSRNTIDGRNPAPMMYETL